MHINGMQVSLMQKTQTGVDAFGAPVYSTVAVQVNNVLVSQPSTEDITTATDQYGKRLSYILGIPKGDNHNWENTEVSFFGKTFKTFGNTIQGIESNIPGPWHKKVMVESYE